MPDADVDNVVNSLLGAAFGSSGERCMALSVAVAVGDEIADTVIAKLQNEISKLKFGHFSNKNNDFGPVITADHKAKVVGFIDSAEQQGAKIVVDGRQATVGDYKKWLLCGTDLN